LATSLARLSSGLRINSAKDDAAGLAISERFTTQIRGMNQAIRNANDGISLAQVAEGALQEVANNLQRIRELAVQARNATNSPSDRAALDAEVQQRIAEIDRVATQTEFNGLKVLDGSFTGAVFQVGANFGQTISVSKISAATVSALGLARGKYYKIEGEEMEGELADGDLKINGVDIRAASSAKELAQAINSSGTGVSAVATTTGEFTLSGPGALDGQTSYVRINGINIGVVAAGANAEEQAASLAEAINRVKDLTGVEAKADGAKLTLTAADGRNIEVKVGGDPAGLS